jgi:succinate-semialdehyde dehydrogenase / glutarate-semialdehyde dehydrogenase
MGRLLMAECAKASRKSRWNWAATHRLSCSPTRTWIEAAVEGAIASKYRNAGQTCVCVNRFYVMTRSMTSSQ